METKTETIGEYFRSIDSKDHFYQVIAIKGHIITLKLRNKSISHEVSIHSKDLSKRFTWVS